MGSGEERHNEERHGKDYHDGGSQRGDVQYEEIVVKLAVSRDYLRKLEHLIDVKRIFSSRAEALRRSLELLFEKYDDVLEKSESNNSNDGNYRKNPAKR
jgi:Arc/MetJ-type ribon-helix-helix transcriptional regulator